MIPPEGVSICRTMEGAARYLALLCVCYCAYGRAASAKDEYVSTPLVVCYLGSWSTYRPSNGQFNIEDIDARLCTHLVYAFAGLDNVTNTIRSLDPEYDITKGAFARAVALKKQNPALKVTLAIGGWTEGSTKYSVMASSVENRRVFVQSVVDFLRKHKFDGLDLDWEYPTRRGGSLEDRNHFVLLVKELKEAFASSSWLLTAAVSAAEDTIVAAYDLPALVTHLDYVHVMTYDYHGKWDGVTGHNSPLYSREDETTAQKALNVNHTISTYLKLGVPPHKLVLGLAFYGRTFLLENVANPGINAAAKTSVAFSGTYTREDGFLGYNEICEKQLAEAGQWQVVWQKAHQAPYMFRDNMWVSYDDDISLELKTNFARRLHLAGVMVWSIDTDDFRGRCHSVKYPLLLALNSALDRDVGHKPTSPDVSKPEDTSGKPDVDLDIDNDLDDDSESGSQSKVSAALSLRSSGFFLLVTLVVTSLQSAL